MTNEAVPDSRASRSIIRVFGGMGVHGEDGPISIGGPRQRRLLALLAIRTGTVAEIDWLSEYLWPDHERPVATAPAIRTYVSRLRQSLPADVAAWLHTEPSGYRIDAPADGVEHRQFAALRTAAREARDVGHPETALQLLDRALDLWRGEPFRELEDLDWARSEIEQLRMERLEACEERWEAALDLGRHTQISAELAAFTSEHGLRERATRQHALALHRSGRTSEALQAISNHRSQLAEETGLEVSSAISELEQQLVTADPDLDLVPVGRPLRGYELIEEIGSGAFSTVWRAEQPAVGREVAIKQIRHELAVQPDFIRRFEAEAHLVARLEHPRIVPLIDFWRDPDSAYLVMRWLKGGTLERRLDDGRLTLEETLVVAQQIGEALAEAHRHGIIHRDVKTANVLFDELGNAYLADFGIALEAAESAGPEAARSPGSPAYSAPEQIRREPLGPAADIFSLGVVVFECLTGSLPFHDVVSVSELVDRQLHAAYPTLAELRADVPANVSAAVARATSKVPDERFQTVEAFLHALDQQSDPSVVEPNAAAAAWAVPAAHPVANPYVGLRAFDSGEADRFFGRVALVDDMISRLDGSGVESRCVVVVGASGSGKSSAVRAGLVPALRRGAVTGSDDWFVTTMIPGHAPFESLEAALLRVAVNPPPTLLDQLVDGERGILRGVRRCLASDTEHVLLVVDQLEEIYTAASPDVADRFLHALAIAVEDPATPLRLVATLRADYYHRPLAHSSFAHILSSASVDVVPLAPDELEQAIIGPAAERGVVMEAGLTARIAAETLAEASPLPLLQYALHALFEQRDGATMTVEAYESIGGLSGALASRGEAVLASADDGQRRALRRVLGRLADPSQDTADLRRRVRVADLGDDPDTTWVLDTLGAERLLTFDRDVSTREPTVEVAHEALFREWPRLAGWLAADRDVLGQLDRVAAAADSWSEGGQSSSDLLRGARLLGASELLAEHPDRLRAIDASYISASEDLAAEDRRKEQQRLTRARRLTAGVAVFAAIAVVGAIVAVVQRNDAQGATARAEIATLMANSAALSTEDPDLAVLLALEAHRRSPSNATEQSVLDAVASGQSFRQVAVFDDPASPDDDCPDIVLSSSDGLADFVNVGGRMLRRDLVSGAMTDFGPSPTGCGPWLADASGSQRFSSSLDARSFRFSTDGGEWIEREFDDATYLDKMTFTARNQLIFHQIDGDEISSLLVLDGRTGETVLGPVSLGRDLLRTEVSADGRLVAAAFGEPGRAGGDGLLAVFDLDTGEPIATLDTALPVVAIAFDAAGDQLATGVLGGPVVVLDVESSEVLLESRLGTEAAVLDIALRPDGSLLVVSESQIETMDRTGTPSTVVELRNAVGARIRDDGLVVVSTTDKESLVLDPESSALAERIWTIDSFAQTAFNNGQVGVITQPDGVPQIVDLETGESRRIELRMDTGEILDAVVVYPEAGGLWAFQQFEAMFARWADDELVETVELGGFAIAGARFGDDFAVLLDTDVGREAKLLDLTPGDASVGLTIPVTGAINVYPTADRGLHVVYPEGRLETYGPDGERQGELETGRRFEENAPIALDPVSGRLAMVAFESGVVLVDPADGTVEQQPGVDNPASLGFAQDGRFLVITNSDGTVRLWDVDRNVSAGLIWRGAGAVSGSPSWFDEASNSIWVATSGKVVEIPLDPQRWVSRACDLVTRDLTQAEWNQYVPGGGEVQSACA